MDVMSELRGMGPLIQAAEFRSVLERIGDLWGRIPEPKTETSNAYMVLEYGVACSLKLGDLDEAQRWASLAPAFAVKRHDSGEVEFLVGKVAFERGEFEIAKENFVVSNRKSGGRSLKGQDRKYALLIHAEGLDTAASPSSPPSFSMLKK